MFCAKCKNLAMIKQSHQCLYCPRVCDNKQERWCSFCSMTKKICTVCGMMTEPDKNMVHPFIGPAGCSTCGRK